LCINSVHIKTSVVDTKSAVSSLDAAFNRTSLLKDTLLQQIMVIRCITAYLYVQKISVFVIIIVHYTNYHVT